jgi:hypothetical protein
MRLHGGFKKKSYTTQKFKTGIFPPRKQTRPCAVDFPSYKLIIFVFSKLGGCGIMIVLMLDIYNGNPFILEIGKI